MNKPLSLKIQGFFTIMMKLSEKEYKKAINELADSYELHLKQWAKRCIDTINEYTTNLQQENEKQKEVIDKITSNIKNDIDGFMTINDHGECNDILDLLNIYLDILNEVTNNE